MKHKKMLKKEKKITLLTINNTLFILSRRKECHHSHTTMKLTKNGMKLIIKRRLVKTKIVITLKFEGQVSFMILL